MTFSYSASQEKCIVLGTKIEVLTRMAMAEEELVGGEVAVREPVARHSGQGPEVSGETTHLGM